MILLTGATGFIGRNFLLRALTAGEEVFTPVRSEEKLRLQLVAEAGFRQVKGSCAGAPHEFRERIHPLPADPDCWPDMAPQHAVLCAGLLSARSPQEYIRTNVDWTMRILGALPASCRTVILSSQSAGGPTLPGRASRNEADPDHPINWYGESKLAMERAVRRQFPDRPITILRPPMVLGPRDRATLPLFRMGRSGLRFKPGFRTKSYSFIAVDDLVDAIFAALTGNVIADPCYVASPGSITDWELIAAAAAACRARGVTLPVPGPAVSLLSVVVGAIPALRVKIPSLTGDRAREIGPARWIVDGTKFEQLTGWCARAGLRETMQAAHDHYVREGAL